MFLWRKITIIEGNYFILEKRVDMIKKTERDTLISKNMEKADVVMNEIFKDSTDKKDFCNNVGYCPADAPPKSQKTSSKYTREINAGAGSSGIDLDTTDMSSYMMDASAASAASAAVPHVGGNVDIREDPYGLFESKNKIEIIEYKEDDVVINKNVKYGVDAEVVADVPSVPVVATMDIIPDSDIADIADIVRDNLEIIETIDNIDNMDNDTISVSSDITFGTDQDKSITKKYKKMNIEKLREECIEKSLSSEGTKAMLIARILEYNKKP
jgi:archaellin